MLAPDSEDVREAECCSSPTPWSLREGFPCFIFCEEISSFQCFQSKESDWLTQWTGPSHTNLFKTILHSCPDSVDSPLLRLLPSEVIPAPVKVTLKLSVTVNLLQKQKLSELKDIPGPLHAVVGM